MVFTNLAWFYMVLLVIYLSVALSVIHGRTGEAEDDDNPGIVDRVCALLHIHKKENSTLWFIDRVVSGFVSACYFGMLGFTGMAPARESTSLPARIVTTGFAFFLLIVGATFTGATAAALVSKTDTGAITGTSVRTLPPAPPPINKRIEDRVARRSGPGREALHGRDHMGNVRTCLSSF